MQKVDVLRWAELSHAVSAEAYHVKAFIARVLGGDAGVRRALATGSDVLQAHSRLAEVAAMMATPTGQERHDADSASQSDSAVDGIVEADDVVAAGVYADAVMRDVRGICSALSELASCMSEDLEQERAHGDAVEALLTDEIVARKALEDEVSARGTATESGLRTMLGRVSQCVL